MSNRACSSREIFVGDERWNIAIVATLPMSFIDPVLRACLLRDRCQVVQGGIIVMFCPGLRVEITGDGRH